jgi:hypothetical protein
MNNIYLFTDLRPALKYFFSLTWRRHHRRWWAAKFIGLSSAFRAFEQGVIYIVPHLLWHGASFFPVSSEGPPHSVTSYDTLGDVEDWLIYCFTSRLRVFHIYWDVTIAGEGLQYLGLCLTLKAFEQGGIFIVPCGTGPRFFRSHPKDRPIQSPFATHKGVWRTYCNPDSHGSVDVEAGSSRVDCLLESHEHFSLIWRLSPLLVTGLQI